VQAVAVLEDITLWLQHVLRSGKPLLAPKSAPTGSADGAEESAVA
jgi:hypothetical protein